MEKKPSPEHYAVTYGETPNGGVKTIAYFFNADGSPCAECDAKSIQILEYDAQGVCVFSLITKANG